MFWYVSHVHQHISMHKPDRAQRGRSKVLVVVDAFRDSQKSIDHAFTARSNLATREDVDQLTSIPGKTGLVTASCSTTLCTNNHCLAALDLINRAHPTNRQKTMPKLDNRGIIAVGTIGFYIPPVILTLFLLIRYALRRDAGWLWLFIFSLCTWINLHP